MIKPLRSVHRAVFVLAAVVLPALLVAGLRARRLPPLVPVAILPAAVPVGPPLPWSTAAGTAVVTLVRERPESALEVELAPATAFRAPDLLLYWTSRSLPVDDVGQPDALLGTVSGEPVKRFRLPPLVQAGHGSLLLFSLAHHSIVGATALPSDSPRTR
jgi:hypothetical protein